MPTHKFLNKLQGKRVVIFGGTVGIGFAIAEGALEHGAIVTVSSSSPEKVSSAVDRLRAAFPQLAAEHINGVVCNLNNKDSSVVETALEALFNKATDNGTHKLNHIAYTAGLPGFGDNRPIDAEVIAQSQAIRVVAPMLISKLIPRFMHVSHESSFTVTGGVGSYKPLEGWSLAAVSGGALEGVVLGLAVDLKPLRINGVVPGPIETERFSSVPAEAKAAFSDHTLLGRFGKPEDTAEAYLYLMKDNFITGSMIHTNGGYLLK
jgi:NAD(P)-dependent dehydrogenase (short-subunit alcohol dehydrogenase family)